MGQGAVGRAAQIFDDDRLEPQVEQVSGRLKDADVGFQPAYMDRMHARPAQGFCDDRGTGRVDGLLKHMTMRRGIECEIRLWRASHHSSPTNQIHVR